MLQIIVFGDRWLVIQATYINGMGELIAKVRGNFSTQSEAEEFIERGGQ